jgi:hypothetical protein
MRCQIPAQHRCSKTRDLSDLYARLVSREKSRWDSLLANLLGFSKFRDSNFLAGKLSGDTLTEEAIFIR